MVAVAKQSPKASTNSSKKQSVLDRIVSVADIETGVKITIYGRSKTGKTRLASTFPKPLLIAATEDGTKSIRTVKGVEFVRLQASTELTEIVDMIKSTGKIKTLVLDTAGGYQDIILKEVLGIEEIPVQKSWGLAKQQEWGQVGVQFKQRMNAVFDLADRYNVNVAVIAHERNFGGDDDASDVMLPSIGAALTPTAAGWLNGASDFIGQTFIREQVTQKKVKMAGTESIIESKTGRKEFCLRVGPHEVYMTGFRLPPGIELPECLINPTFEEISKLIKS